MNLWQWCVWVGCLATTPQLLLVFLMDRAASVGESFATSAVARCTGEPVTPSVLFEFRVPSFIPWTKAGSTLPYFWIAREPAFAVFTLSLLPFISVLL